MKYALCASLLAAVLSAAPAAVFAQAEPQPPPPATDPYGRPLAPPPPAVNGPYGAQPVVVAPPPPVSGPYGAQGTVLVAPPPAVNGPYGAQGGVVVAAPPPAGYRHGGLRLGRSRRMTIPYDGGPIPPGATLHSHMGRGKFIAGMIFMAGLWEISLDAAAYCGYLGYAADAGRLTGLYSLPRCPDTINWLYLPVAGPWIAAFAPSAIAMPDWAKVILVIDGVIQTFGAILTIAGLADRNEYLTVEADNEHEGPRPHRRAENHYMVAPVAAPNSAGLAFAMTF